MTKITLYQAFLDKQNAIMLCVDEDGVIDTDKLDSIEGTFQEKAVACIAVNKTFTHEALALKSQRDSVMNEYNREICRMEASAERLKSRLMGVMQLTGTISIQSDDGLLRARLQNNPPAVDIFEPGLIPAAYMTTPVAPEPAPDKKAIASALKSGIDVQGARLTAGVRLVVS